MIELVEQLLESLGYTVTEGDDFILNFLVTEVQNDFLIDANIENVPEEMTPFLAEQVVGKFLINKRSMGVLDIESLDLDSVKSVSMGDTSVSMGGTSNADLFDNYVNSLLTSGKGKVACYRKLRF